MYRAVVDVDGREEELLGIGAWEIEGHRMDAFRTLFELEDGEAVVLVLRQFLPHVFGETKLFVEPLEVLERRHVRRLEAADLDNLECAAAGTLVGVVIVTA